ncbi:MAG: magnesium chelatase [Actinomycetota bacterium]|nr:magnesium chelatase [Actinomycetota bacterium]MEE2957921.1 magnesium chelatase [Actinomycetota bacterium]
MAFSSSDGTRPTTLGGLRDSGWTSIPVAAELRRNAVTRIRAGEPLFTDVLGYEDTVFPQLENALLAGHDVVFLGERGQAKTRIIRGLTELLDEWMPILAGSEVNDDPYAPVSRYGRDLVAEKGDEAPIDWVHRSDRYGEKLATPDTSIADLIGEVDPIRVAEGRYLSDELTIHYGLVPRTNRGLFAINELPDLAERIQVGLLNVLEERDIQIRGHRVRLPLDVMLFASANPEDYTNRGRIITPLKDRFGSQIRTHYPLEAEVEMDIVLQESTVPNVDGLEVVVPDFMTRVVAVISQEARSSPHLNQRSGVSVRMSVANHEALVASAVRRAIRTGESTAVPRVSDLEALPASMAGKVEVDSLDEGRDGEILERIVQAGVLSTFRNLVPGELHRGVVEAFDDHEGVSTGEDVGSAAYVEVAGSIPALSTAATVVLGDEPESPPDAAREPALVASAVELVLEGLHLSKRLNKRTSGPASRYEARGGGPGANGT